MSSFTSSSTVRKPSPGRARTMKLPPIKESSIERLRRKTEEHRAFLDSFKEDMARFEASRAESEKHAAERFPGYIYQGYLVNDDVVQGHFVNDTVVQGHIVDPTDPKCPFDSFFKAFFDPDYDPMQPTTTVYSESGYVEKDGTIKQVRYPFFDDEGNVIHIRYRAPNPPKFFLIDKLGNRWNQRFDRWERASPFEGFYSVLNSYDYYEDQPSDQFYSVLDFTSTRTDDPINRRPNSLRIDNRGNIIHYRYPLDGKPERIFLMDKIGYIWNQVGRPPLPCRWELDQPRVEEEPKEEPEEPVEPPEEPPSVTLPSMSTGSNGAPFLNPLVGISAAATTGVLGAAYVGKTMYDQRQERLKKQKEEQAQKKAEDALRAQQEQDAIRAQQEQQDAIRAQQEQQEQDALRAQQEQDAIGAQQEQQEQQEQQVTNKEERRSLAAMKQREDDFQMRQQSANSLNRQDALTPRAKHATPLISLRSLQEPKRESARELLLRQNTEIAKQKLRHFKEKGESKEKGKQTLKNIDLTTKTFKNAIQQANATSGGFKKRKESRRRRKRRRSRRS